ncbi:FIG01046148: hypothetical protein [hydrothermal vent metagenome]|uniref:Outer membrane lipoprotein n=1 Tax=hydrothermal vent metagenome TaxID=652676 RepID=A0A3B1AZV0_9ZZZZ
MKGMFLIIISLLLAACFSESYAVKLINGAGAATGEEIYVVSHDWHTGFVVPAQRIQDQLPRLKERFGDTPYIEFGWGDRAFYQAEEYTTELMLKAILWPTESVMHAVAVVEKANEYFPNSEVIPLCLSTAEYASLISYIANSFLKDEKGEILPLQDGIYGDSQFYTATGYFSLMNTCNTWTAKGLQSAGFDISPMFKLTADSVMDYVAAYKQSRSTTVPRPTVICHDLIEQLRSRQ